MTVSGRRLGGGVIKMQDKGGGLVEHLAADVKNWQSQCGEGGAEAQQKQEAFVLTIAAVRSYTACQRTSAEEESMFEQSSDV